MLLQSPSIKAGMLSSARAVVIIVRRQLLAVDSQRRTPRKAIKFSVGWHPINADLQ